METIDNSSPTILTPAYADLCDDMFVAKTANEWMAQAAERRNPQSLWHDLWFEGEVCCLFADTNVGKSIYAIQIAESVARQQPVLYFDFEMSDKQFQLRYTDADTGRLHRFPDNFVRLEFAQTAVGVDRLESIIRSIDLQVMNHRAKVIIIDNISWICNRAESGDAAGELMQMLIALKRKRDLSILVLAHTPKRNISAPLNQNSLAGSKRIANFMDSMMAIGLSKEDRPNGRYIKQIKVRNCEMRYGDTNVIAARMTKRGDMLLIDHVGYDSERSLLDQPDASDDPERSELYDDIRRRIADGQSYRSIASELGVSTKTVTRAAK